MDGGILNGEMRQPSLAYLQFLSFFFFFFMAHILQFLNWIFQRAALRTSRTLLCLLLQRPGRVSATSLIIYINMASERDRGRARKSSGTGAVMKEGETARLQRNIGSKGKTKFRRRILRHYRERSRGLHGNVAVRGRRNYTGSLSPDMPRLSVSLKFICMSTFAAVGFATCSVCVVIARIQRCVAINTTGNAALWCFTLGEADRSLVTRVKGRPFHWDQ